MSTAHRNPWEDNGFVDSTPSSSARTDRKRPRSASVAAPAASTRSPPAPSPESRGPSFPLVGTNSSSSSSSSSSADRRKRDAHAQRGAPPAQELSRSPVARRSSLSQRSRGDQRTSGNDGAGGGGGGGSRTPPPADASSRSPSPPPLTASSQRRHTPHAIPSHSASGPRHAGHDDALAHPQQQQHQLLLAGGPAPVAVSRASPIQRELFSAPADVARAGAATDDEGKGARTAAPPDAPLNRTSQAPSERGAADAMTPAEEDALLASVHWRRCPHSHGRPRFRDTPGYYCTYCAYSVCAGCLTQLPSALRHQPDSEDACASGRRESSVRSRGDRPPAVAPPIADPPAIAAAAAALRAALSSAASAVVATQPGQTDGSGAAAASLSPQSPTLGGRPELRCYLCRSGMLVREAALLHEWTCEGPAPPRRVGRGVRFTYDTEGLQHYYAVRAQRSGRESCSEPLAAVFLGEWEEGPPQPLGGDSPVAVVEEADPYGVAHRLRPSCGSHCCQEGGAFLYAVHNPRVEQACVWCAVNYHARETAAAYVAEPPGRQQPSHDGTAAANGAAVVGGGSVTPLLRWRCPPSLPGLPPRAQSVRVPYGAYGLRNVHALALYVAADLFCTATATVAAGQALGGGPATLVASKVVPSQRARPLLVVTVLHTMAGSPFVDQRLLGGHVEAVDGASPLGAWPDGLAGEELALCVDHLCHGRSVAVYGVGSKRFFLQHVAQSAALRSFEVVTVDASGGRSPAPAPSLARQLRDIARRAKQRAAAAAAALPIPAAASGPPSLDDDGPLVGVLRDPTRAAATAARRVLATANESQRAVSDLSTRHVDIIDVENTSGSNSSSSSGSECKSDAFVAATWGDLSTEPTLRTLPICTRDADGVVLSGSSRLTSAHAIALSTATCTIHAHVDDFNFVFSDLAAVHTADGERVATVVSAPYAVKEPIVNFSSAAVRRQTLDAFAAAVVPADAVWPTRSTDGGGGGAQTAHRPRRCVRWLSQPSFIARRLRSDSPAAPAAPVPSADGAAVTVLVVHNVDDLDAEAAAVLLRLCRSLNSSSSGASSRGGACAASRPVPLRLLLSYDDPTWPAAAADSSGTRLSSLAAALAPAALAHVQLRSLLQPRQHEMQHVNSLALLTASEAAAAASSTRGGLAAAGFTRARPRATLPLADTLRRTLLSMPAATLEVLRLLVDVQNGYGDDEFASLQSILEELERRGQMMASSRMMRLASVLESSRLAVFKRAENALMLPQHRRLGKALEEVAALRPKGGGS